MNTRQILFTRPRVAELVTSALPELGPNDVLVRMAHTVVSAGTERANLMGEANVNGAVITDEVVFPRAFGYSGSGVVERVGDAVKSVAPGDRVVTYFGKHASRWVLPEQNAVKICDERVSMLDAAFVVIAGFSLAGVRKTRLEIGEAALVVGLGILGQFAVQFEAIGGASPVIACDLNAARRELALRVGADFALDPSEPGFAERAKALMGGRGADSIVEVTGVAAALQQALECAAPFGRVALLGCTRHPNADVDFYHRVHFPGVSLVGANNFARPLYESRPGNWTFRDDCGAMLRLLAAGKLQVAPLVGEVRAPKDAPEVYDRLAEGRDFPIGVAFDWTGED